MMKAAGFICLMVIPCFLWDGKSLIFPFVLLIGINVRGAKEAGLVHLELAYLNRFTFFCHGVCIDINRNFVRALFLK